MQIGPVTENRVVRLNDETGYQSNRIFCHTNHFSSYKLEEAVGQDAFTDTSMSFPGSAPGKRLKKPAYQHTCRAPHWQTQSKKKSL